MKLIFENYLKLNENKISKFIDKDDDTIHNIPINGDKIEFFILNLEDNEKYMKYVLKLSSNDWVSSLDGYLYYAFDLQSRINTVNNINEAEYKGKEVELNKPFRTPDGPKKFSVYVKDGDKIKKVNFGDPNSTIKNYDIDKAKSFQARHNCKDKTDKTTPGWWSCNIGSYAELVGLKSSRPW